MKKLSVFLVLIAFVLSAVACGGGGGTDPGTGTEVKFKAGAATEFAITDSLIVENYVDTSLYEGYVLTITDASGKEETISGATWRPSAPGQYTLKLTVGENSAEMKITVTASEMTWTHANATPVYLAGETVQFDEYIAQFNIVVNAYNNDYELFVDRIVVDGKTTDVSEQDSYTLASTSAHTVVIKAVSGDGQELELSTTLYVRTEADPDTQAWMEENNITVGGNWLAIEKDNTFRLGAGSFTGNLWDGVSNVNVPYVALKGDYGFDDAVTVTFTGRYAPDIAFFVGEEADGRTWAGQNAKGLIAYNGLFLNNGDPENATESGVCANIETAGNFMMNKGFNVKETEEQNPEEGNEGARKWPIWKCPASWYYLKDDHEYSYTMYYSQLDRLDDKGVPYDSKPDKIKLVLIVKDLTTNEVIFDNSDLYPEGDTYTNEDAKGNKWYGVFDNDVAFDNADFFTGNILIYGKFGNTIEFKIEQIPQKEAATA